MVEVINIKNLTKTFGTVKAVDDISMTVKHGELLGLLGPNGSGKTTIIKLLTGQIKPTNGSINVLGIDVLKDSVGVRKVIGIIPEQETPPSFLTAEEYLYFVAKIRKIHNVKKKCNWWFKYLDFRDQKDMLCKDLSRGTRQKLMVAQAFIHNPKLAFIDEPLINLDPIIQRKIKDFLIDYIKHSTVFFSTHVLEIAHEICTKVAVLYKGKIIHQASAKKLKGKNLEKMFIKWVESA